MDPAAARELLGLSPGRNPKRPLECTLDDLEGDVFPNQTNLVKIDPILQCPICFEQMISSQVTECGHTFCNSCINHLKANCENQIFSCPTCKSQVTKVCPNLLIDQLVARKNMASEQNEIEIGTEELDHVKNWIQNRQEAFTLETVNNLLKMIGSIKSSIEEKDKSEANVLVIEFLKLMRQYRLKQIKMLQSELEIINKDYQASLASSSTSDTALNTQETKTSVTEQQQDPCISVRSEDQTPCTSAQAIERDAKLSTYASVPMEQSSQHNVSDIEASGTIPRRPEEYKAFNSVSAGDCPHSDTSKRATSRSTTLAKMRSYYSEFEKFYLSRVTEHHLKGVDQRRRLVELRDVLRKATFYSTIRPLASFTHERDFPLVSNSATSIDFDKDAEFFAIGGMGKKVLIFDYMDILTKKHLVDPPISEVVCNRRVSCISWNSYYKSMLAVGDYNGQVSLWDSFLSEQLIGLQGHDKHIWCVAHNKLDHKMFATGSDDERLKLWCHNQVQPLLSIQAKAPVTAVQFNPGDVYHMAYGCGNHCVYYVDLRNAREPLFTLRDHKGAISRLSFLKKDELLTAAIDSQVKLWTPTDQMSSWQCERIFTGHTNERLFVGISNQSGYFAIGSECNSVFVFYKMLPQPIAVYNFQQVLEPGREDAKDFCSAVCWRNNTNSIVAANSQATIKILELA